MESSIIDWMLAYMSGSLNPVIFVPLGHEGAAWSQGLRSVRGMFISTLADNGKELLVLRLTVVILESP